MSLNHIISALFSVFLLALHGHSASGEAMKPSLRPRVIILSQMPMHQVVYEKPRWGCYKSDDALKVLEAGTASAAQAQQLLLYLEDSRTFERPACHVFTPQEVKLGKLIITESLESGVVKSDQGYSIQVWLIGIQMPNTFTYYMLTARHPIDTRPPKQEAPHKDV